jgi:hypothetical protein
MMQETMNERSAQRKFSLYTGQNNTEKCRHNLYAPIGFRTRDLLVEKLVLEQRRHYDQQMLLTFAITEHRYCIVV